MARRRLVNGPLWLLNWSPKEISSSSVRIWYFWVFCVIMVVMAKSKSGTGSGSGGKVGSPTGPSPIRKAACAITREGGDIVRRIDPATAELKGEEWVRSLPPAPIATLQDPETGAVEQVRSLPRGQAGDVPLELENAALTSLAGGMSMAAVEAKYELSAGYVRNCLARRFRTPEEMKRALRGLLLELGLACGEHTLANIESLHPSQSGMLTSVMTNAVIALEKHERETPRAVDFAALAGIGEALARLEKYAGVALVVDVEAQAVKSGSSPAGDSELAGGGGGGGGGTSSGSVSVELKLPAS